MYLLPRWLFKVQQHLSYNLKVPTYYCTYLPSTTRHLVDKLYASVCAQCQDRKYDISGTSTTMPTSYDGHAHTTLHPI